MELIELQRGIEAILFAAGERIEISRLSMALEVDPDEIEKAADKNALIKEKAAEYETLQSSAIAAAKRGYVDDVIEPDATRKRVIAAMEMLFTKREDRPSKKHGTV